MPPKKRNKKSPSPEILSKKIPVANGQTFAQQPATPEKVTSPAGSSCSFFRHPSGEGKLSGWTPNKGHVVALEPEKQGYSHVIADSPNGHIYRSGGSKRQHNPEAALNALMLDLMVLKRRLDKDYSAWQNRSHLKATYEHARTCTDSLLSLYQTNPNDFTDSLLQINQAITAETDETSIYNPFAVQALYHYNHTTSTYTFNRTAAEDMTPLRAVITTEMLTELSQKENQSARNLGF
jgi:hypothetical protein